MLESVPDEATEEKQQNENDYQNGNGGTCFDIFFIHLFLKVYLEFVFYLTLLKDIPCKFDKFALVVRSENFLWAGRRVHR